MRRKKRDLCEKDFLRKLAEMGFERDKYMSTHYIHGDIPGVHFGCCYNLKPFKLNRRATIESLQQALQRRKEAR